MTALPLWAGELATLYESGAYSQFLLLGNVHDELCFDRDGASQLAGLEAFLLELLLPRFDVVLGYDVGNGIRVERGAAIVEDWPFLKEGNPLPRAPRAAIETLTRFLRYAANLAQVSPRTLQVAVILRDAELFAPDPGGAFHPDLGATASLIRDWSRDAAFQRLPLASFLITENRNDLHPLLVQNPRSAHVEVPLPGRSELAAALEHWVRECPVALGAYANAPGPLAERLVGATASSVEALLRDREHRAEPLTDADWSALKCALVERECNGLVEFVEPDRSLADYVGHESVVEWLRQDIALWHRGELDALPMGYLLCGPVGTGKTFLAECLAGEAGVPMVKLRNFRDRWVGSTESNLERIFRLLHALGRCIVFVDEADQALGARSSGGDSGVSGRVYSMLADEMSDTRNRGRLVWLLASSRPDLIEVDLKRPGRIDVVLPLFPTATPQESARLLGALLQARGIDVDLTASSLPLGLTPGAAEALAVKILRQVKGEGRAPADALADCLAHARPAVPPEAMAFQVGLAVEAASDLSLVPPAYRPQ